MHVHVEITEDHMMGKMFCDNFLVSTFWNPKGSCELFLVCTHTLEPSSSVENEEDLAGTLQNEQRLERPNGKEKNAAKGANRCLFPASHEM